MNATRISATPTVRQRLASADEALTVACPTCGADPGEWCRRIEYVSIGGTGALRVVTAAPTLNPYQQHGKRHRRYAETRGAAERLAELERLRTWILANADLFAPL